jgi:peptide deformylase
MALRSLVYAPDPIFKQKAQAVEVVDDAIRQLVDDMLETLEFEQGVGMGANMIGELKRIAVVDLHEDGVANPQVFINPEIIWRSDEMQTNEEASLCFVGISAEVTRPQAIRVRYLDRDGQEQELEADGFLACVIQHEVDYLDGITFLDHLSKMKRDMLMKKMLKHIKQHPPHVHGPGCHH